MRILTFLLLLFVVYTAFAQDVFIPTDPRVCTDVEKQPGPCTFLYKPVCGMYLNSEGEQIKQTFSNKCFACKNPQVKYVFQNACSSYPNNAQFCTPYPGAMVLCADIYDPVCGYFGQNIQCLVAPCATNASNACMACLNNNVDYYLPGVCPTFDYNKKP